jgi:putative transposase
MVIRKTSHARYDLWYHLVWATKYRKRIFTKPYTQERIKEIIREVAVQYDMEIGTIECVSDHIHMTISAPSRIAPSRVAQILKSVSTKLFFQNFLWLKKYYWGGEIWAGGYFIRSVGPRLTKEQVDRYVLAQTKEL